jgi:hypothetical protein
MRAWCISLLAEGNMKVGAGILGILWGFFALLTFGLFYGAFQSAAEEFHRAVGDSTGAQSQAHINKYVGIGLPLLALGGGAISFSQGFIGGLMMIGSAVGIYIKMQQTFMGLVLAGPLALAGVIAIIGELAGGKSVRIG